MGEPSVEEIEMAEEQVDPNRGVISTETFFSMCYFDTKRKKVFLNIENTEKAIAEARLERKRHMERVEKARERFARYVASKQREESAKDTEAENARLRAEIELLKKEKVERAAGAAFSRKTDNKKKAKKNKKSK